MLVGTSCNAQRVFSVVSGAHDRSYLVYSPKERYVDGTSAFIVLHRNGQTALHTFGSRQLWDGLSKPAWLVFPNAINQTWNCNVAPNVAEPGDPAFLSTLIRLLSDNFSVNQANIYVLFGDDHECLVEHLRADHALVTFIKVNAHKNIGEPSVPLIEQKNAGVISAVPQQHFAEDNTTYFRSKEDSLRFIKGDLLPLYDFRFGTQAPLQIFGALEVSVFNNGTLWFGYGQLFKPYMSLIFSRIKRRPGADSGKLDFLYRRYDGGRIWTVGAKFHHRRFYTGATVQFLKVGFKATPQMLVQTLAPEKAEEIEDKIDNSGYRRIRDFYESQVIRPVVFNTQIGLLLGYRLPLPFVPRLSIGCEASYSIIVYSKGKMDTSGGILSNALSRIVQNDINNRLTDKFVGVRIPSLSLSVGYSFGYK